MTLHCLSLLGIPPPLPSSDSRRSFHGVACEAEGSSGGHPQRPQPRASVYLYGACPRPALFDPRVRTPSEMQLLLNIDAYIFFLVFLPFFLLIMTFSFPAQLVRGFIPTAALWTTPSFFVS